MRLKSKDTVERAWSYQGKLFMKDKFDTTEEVKFKDFAFWLSKSWPEKENMTTELQTKQKEVKYKIYQKYKQLKQTMADTQLYNINIRVQSDIINKQTNI